MLCAYRYDKRKWLLGGIALQLSVGYTVSYLVYQIGTVITTGSVGAGFIPGLLAVAIIVSIIVYLCINPSHKINVKNAVNR